MVGLLKSEFNQGVVHTLCIAVQLLNFFFSVVVSLSFFKFLFLSNLHPNMRLEPPTSRSRSHMLGSLDGAVVQRLPLAQGAILETRDRIPRQAPGTWSLLLPLPLSLSLSLSLCDYHKKKTIQEKKKKFCIFLSTSVNTSFNVPLLYFQHLA